MYCLKDCFSSQEGHSLRSWEDENIKYAATGELTVLQKRRPVFCNSSYVDLLIKQLSTVWVSLLRKQSSKNALQCMYSTQWNLWSYLNDNSALWKVLVLNYYIIQLK